MRVPFVLVGCAVAGVAPLTAMAGPADKIIVCHLDGQGRYDPIEISDSAAASHVDHHGDVAPGTWYPDADGDGYGAPTGAPLPCPALGYAPNALDCDDYDATANPGADEVCDDGYDDDCDGVADDGCVVTCPCFDAAAVLAGIDWVSGSATCQLTAYSSGLVLELNAQSGSRGAYYSARDYTVSGPECWGLEGESTANGVIWYREYTAVAVTESEYAACVDAIYAAGVCPQP